MMADLYPLPVLLVTLAGWVNRHQQHVIEYLVEEHRVLKEQAKGRRVLPTEGLPGWPLPRNWRVRPSLHPRPVSPSARS
jgi:hypothetical protein